MDSEDLEYILDKFEDLDVVREDAKRALEDIDEFSREIRVAVSNGVNDKSNDIFITAFLQALEYYEVQDKIVEIVKNATTGKDRQA